MFEAISKYKKGDWGILPEADKEENNRAIKEGGPILGLYNAGKYDIVVVMGKERSKIEVVMKHEIGKEIIHDPVIYDSKGIRITK